MHSASMILFGQVEVIAGHAGIAFLHN